jgi:hypothetical protein
MNFKTLAEPVIDLSYAYYEKEFKSLAFISSKSQITYPVYRGSDKGAYNVEIIGMGTYSYSQVTGCFFRE